MPLRIDIDKCENPDPSRMETLAHIMHAVGVGQIRDEQEARKLYRRYYLFRLAHNDAMHPIQLFPYKMMLRFVGAHTNVSDVSDFQFNKHLILIMTSTADARLDKELTL